MSTDCVLWKTTLNKQNHFVFDGVFLYHPKNFNDYSLYGKAMPRPNGPWLYPCTQVSLMSLTLGCLLTGVMAAMWQFRVY